MRYMIFIILPPLVFCIFKIKKKKNHMGQSKTYWTCILNLKNYFLHLFAFLRLKSNIIIEFANLQDTPFSRQKYWTGLPFPFPWDLPDLVIEPWSPALQADSLPAELLGKRN